MPQLMPLNWVFSSFMISLVVVSACLIYSEKIEISALNNGTNSVMNKTDLWFW
uniref:ATP synthase F0 subunit 8 n=1 Tax=Argiope perforata TaxID=716558 RepID=A0A5B9REF0_9ARAC|nr:ATP synthase F0 subunit 8 [Argiope perforata]QEG58618.1 ATP synthase F0 subunit 8 [Argiope perforata]